MRRERRSIRRLGQTTAARRPSRLLKKVAWRPLPDRRGSVSARKHALPLPSRARQQALLRLFQQPARYISSSRCGYHFEECGENVAEIAGALRDGGLTGLKRST